MRYREFGNTGLEVSALGFGTMRLPLLEGDVVDVDEAVRIIRHAIDSGVNYIDTAYPYHKGESENIVGKALEAGYRDKVYIADKCPVWLVEKEDDFERILDEQLHKLKTDHIDFYLLHALDRPRFEEKVKKFGLVDKMLQAKASGKIKYLGFSFHDEYQVFEEIVDYTDVWDFCQIQYNYIDLVEQAGTKGLEYAASKGLAVVIMEPLLGGRLANLTPYLASFLPGKKTPVEYALDFLWDKPEVSLLLSGMGNEEQVKDNLIYADRSSIGMMTEEERPYYLKTKEEFDKMALVGCTGCAYCMPCPFGLPIPDIFAAYNRTASHGMKEAGYESLAVKADACKACHRCEKECPQHIKISDMMVKVAAKFQ